MKRTYIVPTLRIAHLEAAQLLAASKPPVQYVDEKADANFDALSQRKDFEWKTPHVWE